MSDKRLLKLFKQWERTSAKTGKPYLSGFLGDLKLVTFCKEEPHPKNPGETIRVWTTFAEERDPDRRPQARQDERPRQDGQSGGQADASRSAPARAPGGAILDAQPRDRDRGDWSTDPGQHDGPGGPADEIPF